MVITRGNTDSASDLTLATAQLGLGIEVNEYFSGKLIVLFEEDTEGDDRIEVDETTVNLASGPWSGRIGRQYLPFGHFHSHFISDPLTLELSASYLSDLADSDAELADDYQHRVGGWSAYAEGIIGPLKLSGEILGASRHFAAADLDADGNSKGDRPLTWNLEAATDLTETVEVALRLEGSRELAEQPKIQCGAGISWSPRPHISLSLEYLRGEFDRRFAATDDFGSPMQTRDMVSSQLAIEF